MNHASTSDGARHLDAFIDALAGRHRRLARLALLTRSALVVAIIWVAALGVWFLAARDSTRGPDTAGCRGPGGVHRRRRDGLASAGPAADATAAGAPGRGPPAGPRRPAGDVGRHARAAVAAAEGPLAQLLLDDTARRVSDDDVELVVLGLAGARRDLPGRGRRRVLLALIAFVAREPVGRAGRRCGCGRFPTGWRSRSRPATRACGRRRPLRCARRRPRPRAGWCPTSPCACRTRRARRA